jgi:acyl carrier protein
MQARCGRHPCPRRALACARLDEQLDLAPEDVACVPSRDGNYALAAPGAMSARTHGEVFALIQAHLADELDVEAGAIGEATRFKEDLEADSLDLYTLVQELEDTYGVSMSDEQAAQILTVGQAVDFVLAHDGAANGRP